jgi:hypothetical protein
VVVIAGLTFSLSGMALGMAALTKTQGPATTAAGAPAPGSAGPPASLSPSQQALADAVGAYYSNVCAPANRTGNAGLCDAFDAALHDALAACFVDACSPAGRARNPGPCSAPAIGVGAYYAFHPKEAAEVFGRGPP